MPFPWHTEFSHERIRARWENLPSGPDAVGLAGEHSPGTTEFDRLRELSSLAHGHRGAWRFDRDELHERA